MRDSPLDPKRPRSPDPTPPSTYISRIARRTVAYRKCPRWRSFWFLWGVRRAWSKARKARALQAMYLNHERVIRLVDLEMAATAYFNTGTSVDLETFSRAMKTHLTAVCDEEKNVRPGD